MFVLAFDPGRTTGWASFRKPESVELRYRSGQLQETEVWGFLGTGTFGGTPERLPTHVVIESFKYRQLPRADLTPVEIIGIIKQWCRNHDVPVTMQTPSQAKAFWSDERLREQKLYRPGKPHANDAMRHLMYFLNFGRGVHLGERVVFKKEDA